MTLIKGCETQARSQKDPLQEHNLSQHLETNNIQQKLHSRKESERPQTPGVLALDLKGINVKALGPCKAWRLGSLSYPLPHRYGAVWRRLW